MTKRPKIAKAQGRSVEEWVGATPDTWPPPPRVKLRILRRHNHTCHITGIKIPPGVTPDFDHIKRLDDGGENRESNIAPALPGAHKKKTKEERERAKKADAVAKKAAGIAGPKAEIKSRGFAPVEKPPKAGGVRIDKSALPPLPPRAMFR